MFILLAVKLQLDFDTFITILRCSSFCVSVISYIRFISRAMQETVCLTSSRWRVSSIVRDFAICYADFVIEIVLEVTKKITIEYEALYFDHNLNSVATPPPQLIVVRSTGY